MQLEKKNIISFDIGIRNLAYCVFSQTNQNILAWDVLDISKEEGQREMEPIKEEMCSCVLLSKKKETCKKKAKYTNKKGFFFCEKHAKEKQEKREYYIPTKEFQIAFLKKQKVDVLVEFERKYGLESGSGSGSGSEKKEKKDDRLERIERWLQENVLELVNNLKNQKKKEEIGLVQIGRNMANHLYAIPETMQEIDTVVIENQISPIANKMKTIQGMLAQIYILHGVPNIEFISSCNKLKGFSSSQIEEEIPCTLALKGFIQREEEVEDKEKDGEPEKKTKTKTKTKNPNPNYKKHKKDGIQYCKELLEKREETKWKTFFETYPKKQDDLADAFLQGIWFLNKKK